MNTDSGTADTPQQAALLQLAAATRTLIDHIVQLDADAADIEALAQAVTALNHRMAALPHGRALPHYDLALAKTRTAHTLPCSPVSGPFNPVAPPVDMQYDADTGEVIGRVRCGRAYEGPERMVHGAVIAGIYDQLLALVSATTGLPSFTAYLHTEFRKPTPLYEELVFRAGVERVEGRKMFIKGHCTLDGELLTETEGLFIQLKRNEI